SLYRLDDRPRAYWRFGLERFYGIRDVVLAGATHVGHTSVLKKISHQSLLAGHHWYCTVCGAVILGRFCPGANVEDLYRRRPVEIPVPGNGDPYYSDVCYP